MTGQVDWNIYLSLLEENSILKQKIDSLVITHNYYDSFDINLLLNQQDIERSLDKTKQIEILNKQLEDSYKEIALYKNVSNQYVLDELNQSNIQLQQDNIKLYTELQLLKEEKQQFQEDLYSALSLQDIIQLFQKFELTINQVMQTIFTTNQTQLTTISDENKQNLQQILILKQKIYERDQQLEIALDENKNLQENHKSIEEKTYLFEKEFSQTKFVLEKSALTTNQQYQNQIQQLEFDAQQLKQQLEFQDKKYNALNNEYQSVMEKNDNLKNDMRQMEKYENQHSKELKVLQQSDLIVQKLLNLFDLTENNDLYETIYLENRIISILKQKFEAETKDILKQIKTKFQQAKTSCSKCYQYQNFICQTLETLDYYVHQVQQLEIPEIITLESVLTKFPFLIPKPVQQTQQIIERIDRSRTIQQNQQKFNQQVQQKQPDDDFYYSDILDLSDAEEKKQSIAQVSNISQDSNLNNKLADEFKKLNQALQQQKEKSMISINTSIIKSQNYSHQPEKVNIRKAPLTPEDMLQNTLKRSDLYSTPVKMQQSPPKQINRQMSLNSSKSINSRASIRQKLQAVQKK